MKFGINIILWGKVIKNFLNFFLNSRFLYYNFNKFDSTLIGKYDSYYVLLILIFIYELFYSLIFNLYLDEIIVSLIYDLIFLPFFFFFITYKYFNIVKINDSFKQIRNTLSYILLFPLFLIFSLKLLIEFLPTILFPITVMFKLFIFPFFIILILFYTTFILSRFLVKKYILKNGYLKLVPFFIFLIILFYIMIILVKIMFLYVMFQII